MPTGYTAGILDGTITDFKTFATQCLRAFGATIHMRDDPMDKPYEPRVPSDYHQKELDKCHAEIERLKITSDASLVEERRVYLLSEIEYNENQIGVKSSKRATLNEMLASVVEWQPPTPGHEEFKKFMIDQIKQTIPFDTNTDYNSTRIELYQAELASLNALDLRQALNDKLEKDVAYHTKELNEELGRCAQANQFVEQLLATL